MPSLADIFQFVLLSFQCFVASVTPWRARLGHEGESGHGNVLGLSDPKVFSFLPPSPSWHVTLINGHDLKWKYFEVKPKSVSRLFHFTVFSAQGFSTVAYFGHFGPVNLFWSVVLCIKSGVTIPGLYSWDATETWNLSSGSEKCPLTFPISPVGQITSSWETWLENVPLCGISVKGISSFLKIYFYYRAFFSYIWIHKTENQLNPEKKKKKGYLLAGFSGLFQKRRS